MWQRKWNCKVLKKTGTQFHQGDVPFFSKKEYGQHEKRTIHTLFSTNKSAVFILCCSCFIYVCMELKTDEFAWGMTDLFKIKEQANYIIAGILSLSNSANLQRDCKTLIWVIVSIIYVENKISIMKIMVTAKYRTYKFALQHTVTKD